jgi:hypothetical protein
MPAEMRLAQDEQQQFLRVVDRCLSRPQPRAPQNLDNRATKWKFMAYSRLTRCRNSYDLLVEILQYVLGYVHVYSSAYSNSSTVEITSEENSSTVESRSAASRPVTTSSSLPSVTHPATSPFSAHHSTVRVGDVRDDLRRTRVLSVRMSDKPKHMPVHNCTTSPRTYAIDISGAVVHTRAFRRVAYSNTCTCTC